MRTPTVFPECGFNTQPPEGGCIPFCADSDSGNVSTHSRPKAAAVSGFHMFGFDCFNTQPPEGG